VSSRECLPAVTELSLQQIPTCGCGFEPEEKGEVALKRLYVGNLPFQASENDLQDWFTRSEVNVASVNLMRDRVSGDPRGFGFVEVADEDMDRAIKTCNGKDFLGRALVVNEARPMREAGAGGGFGGSGGGGGRRPGGGGGGGGGRPGGGNRRRF
jgi:cold-inducible RNA-binding protein